VTHYLSDRFLTPLLQSYLPFCGFSLSSAPSSAPHPPPPIPPARVTVPLLIERLLPLVLVFSPARVLWVFCDTTSVVPFTSYTAIPATSNKCRRQVPCRVPPFDGIFSNPLSGDLPSFLKRTRLSQFPRATVLSPPDAHPPCYIFSAFPRRPLNLFWYLPFTGATFALRKTILCRPPPPPPQILLLYFQSSPLRVTARPPPIPPSFVFFFSFFFFPNLNRGPFPPPGNLPWSEGFSIGPE